MTEQQPTEPRKTRTLAAVYAAAAPSNGVVSAAYASLRQNPAVVEAARSALNVASLSAYAEATRTWEQLLMEQFARLYEPNKQIVELYSKLVGANEAVQRTAASLNLTGISAVLREFDGLNWPKLADGLDSVSVSDWSPPIAARTSEDPATLTESAHVEKSPPDWRTDPWLGYAVLAAALYFTCSFSAEIVWPELTAALRDNLIAALAIYGALREWNRRHGR